MIEITSIPSGEEAIVNLKELMANDAYSDSMVERQLFKNKEELELAKKVLSEKVEEKIEANILNTLQNLESWMMHNKSFRGTHASFLALRVLNTHLIILFFQRYR